MSLAVTSVVTLGATLDATSVSLVVEPLAVIPLVEMALLAVAWVVENDLLLVVEFVVVFFYLLSGMDSMMLLKLELHMMDESLPVVVPPLDGALVQ